MPENTLDWLNAAIKNRLSNIGQEESRLKPDATKYPTVKRRRAGVTETVILLDDDTPPVSSSGKGPKPAKPEEKPHNKGSEKGKPKGPVHKPISLAPPPPPTGEIRPGPTAGLPILEKGPPKGKKARKGAKGHGKSADKPKGKEVNSFLDVGIENTDGNKGSGKKPDVKNPPLLAVDRIAMGYEPNEKNILGSGKKGKKGKKNDPGGERPGEHLRFSGGANAAATKAPADPRPGEHLRFGGVGAGMKSGDSRERRPRRAL